MLFVAGVPLPPLADGPPAAWWSRRTGVVLPRPLPVPAPHGVPAPRGRAAHRTGYQTIQSLVGLANGGVLGHSARGVAGPSGASCPRPTPTSSSPSSARSSASSAPHGHRLPGRPGRRGHRDRAALRRPLRDARRHGHHHLDRVQALINMGAVVGVLPITGVPLPFVSFGGSSLVVSLLAVGVLFSGPVGRSGDGPCGPSTGAPVHPTVGLGGRRRTDAPAATRPVAQRRRPGTVDGGTAPPQPACALVAGWRHRRPRAARPRRGQRARRAGPRSGHDPLRRAASGASRRPRCPRPASVSLLPGRGIQRRLTLENLAAASGWCARAVARPSALVRRRRPAVVLVLGGYASVACVIAAVLWRVPIVVAEQNARAGAANRLAGPLRRRPPPCPSPSTDLPRKVVTGNPVRARGARSTGGADRAAAREALGLPLGPHRGRRVRRLARARKVNQAPAGGAALAWAGRTWPSAT